VGADAGKANCHSDYVDDADARQIQLVQLNGAAGQS
jgi:hypothetical protein